ncbi:MAG: DUF2752 domain-containing protein [Clostridiales bacterium]|nr:DUF2752 domain-containing protein [Clostridiales bacterium]
MSTVWKKTIRDVFIILAAGFVYYIVNRLTGFGFTCPVKQFTGYPCPSCGITHMAIDLIALDFKSAFKDNQFLFVTWPLLASEILFVIYNIEAKKDLPRWNVIALSVFAGLLITFGFLRIAYSW